MWLDPLLVVGQLFSFSTLMLLLGLLICKTVSRITYTMLVETLNPALSIDIYCSIYIDLVSTSNISKKTVTFLYVQTFFSTKMHFIGFQTKQKSQSTYLQWQFRWTAGVFGFLSEDVTLVEVTMLTDVILAIFDSTSTGWIRLTNAPRRTSQLTEIFQPPDNRHHSIHITNILTMITVVG